MSIKYKNFYSYLTLSITTIICTQVFTYNLSHAQSINMSNGSAVNSEAFPSDQKDFSKNIDNNMNNPILESNQSPETESPIDNSTYNEVAKQLGFIEFPSDVEGIKDTEGASVVRSLDRGVSVQYLIFDDKIKESLIDTRVLTEEINEYVKGAGRYFKKNPHFKGGLITYFTLYPGFKHPFQYDLSVATSEQQFKILENRNVLLKKITNCNSAGLCGAFVIEGVKYFINVPSEKNDFDLMEFEDHLILENRKGRQIFAYNKDFNEPITLTLFLGTNGYSIRPEQVKLELDILDE